MRKKIAIDIEFIGDKTIWNNSLILLKWNENLDLNGVRSYLEHEKLAESDSSELMLALLSLTQYTNTPPLAKKSVSDSEKSVAKRPRKKLKSNSPQKGHVSAHNLQPGLGTNIRNRHILEFFEEDYCPTRIISQSR